MSLEPCAHHGKTPPCADAIIARGVSRVVAAVRDPSRDRQRRRRASFAPRASTPTVAASRTRRRDRAERAVLSRAGERASVGDAQARALRRRSRSPIRRRTIAWITGAASRAEVHRLRANSDAIAVGIGTVLADDPALTVRDAPAPRVAPRRVVFDSQARTPLESALVRTARDDPPTVVDRAAGSRRSGRRRAVESGRRRGHRTPISTRRSLALRARGVRSLLRRGRRAARRVVPRAIARRPAHYLSLTDHRRPRRSARSTSRHPDSRRRSRERAWSTSGRSATTP